MDSTRVVFRTFSDGEVIALFPDQTWYDHQSDTVDSYMRFGQHGAASYSYVIAHTRPATRDQYLDLAAELTSIGYDLHVAHRR
jgi:hypothetical protein